MLEFTCVFVVTVALAGLDYCDAARDCPSGATIFELGNAQEDTEAAVAVINKYRKNIARGLVTGQPRGVDLKRVSGDANLAHLARDVSYTCTFERHVAGLVDARWPYIQKTGYRNCLHVNETQLSWSAVMEVWFKEHKDFTYPAKRKGKRRVENYLQIVWANTTNVGCDQIYYHDPSSKFPYCRLYTCVYGPGASFGKAPYTTACDNLC